MTAEWTDAFAQLPKDRLAELERRERLLTEIVRILDREKQLGGVSHHYQNLFVRYQKARNALDWLPPEPEFAGYQKVSGWPVDEHWQSDAPKEDRP